MKQVTVILRWPKKIDASIQLTAQFFKDSFVTRTNFNSIDPNRNFKKDQKQTVVFSSGLKNGSNKKIFCSKSKKGSKKFGNNQDEELHRFQINFVFYHIKDLCFKERALELFQSNLNVTSFV